MAGQGAKARSIAAASGVLSPTLRSSASGTNTVPSLLQKSAVRRLTVTECERLQGYPDDYTAISYKRPFADLPKPILERSYRRYLRRMAKRGEEPQRLGDLIKCADGPRYKAIGNSMAVPVMRWIGERIEKLEKQ
jgi:DNA (cytosine-5)-methyltransferase 1